jgi:alpha-N-arabinofuranosidase
MIKARQRITINFFILTFIGIFILIPGVYGAACGRHTLSALITVDAAQTQGRVNPWLFGNNLSGYDPTSYQKGAREPMRFSKFGAGIWDPKENQPNPRMIRLLEETGVSAVRFPGGCGTHHYDWRKAVGPGRNQFIFGIDEFLQVARKLNAEPIFTLSFFTGDAMDQADLVEYLNAPDDGSNPHGGIDWARERAKNGHAQPYHIKYFEVGNEVWHGDHREIDHVSSEDYARKYLACYEAMKAVDPNIQIGVLMHSEAWDETVLRMVRDRFDFGVKHYYFSASWAGKELTEQDPRKIFYATIQEPQHYTSKVRKILERMERFAGAKRPLAITEYNTAFTQSEPLPYRHTLGAALVNTSVLFFLMDLEDSVLMANYWDWSSQFWGMVTNFLPASQKALETPYIKRPNFYVHELFHKHFGTTRIKTQQRGQNGFLFVRSTMDKEQTTIYMAVINAHMEEAISSKIRLENFAGKLRAEAWTLNGPSVDATNEQGHVSVGVNHKRINVTDGELKHSFMPHSVTFLEIIRLQ